MEQLMQKFCFDQSILIIFLFAFAIFTVKLLWRRRKLYLSSWKAEGPPAWPLIGNALYFAGGADELLNKVMSLLGNYRAPVRLWIGPRLFFLVSEPGHFEAVLNAALDKEQVYDFIKPLIGNGLVGAPVSQWRRHRKVILPTFNQRILNSFVEVFVSHANTLVKDLEGHSGGTAFDPFPLIGTCTLNIICETVLGMKVASGGSEHFVDWLGRALEIINIRILKVWYHPEFLWRLTSLSKELDSLVLRINEFLTNIVVQKKEALMRNQRTRNPESAGTKRAFLDYMIEVSEQKEKWTDEEVKEEAVTIAIGGSDISANVITFTLMMLGMHLEIQTKVQDELDAIFGRSNRNLTAEDLPNLRYLGLVIKETMRLFPPGPFLARAINEDLKLDDSHVFPKGSSVILGVIYSHRSPRIWKEPLRFVPERFLLKETAKRHPYAYIPFSAGPRNCIGPRYGTMSMKSVLATVLRHYKVRTDYKKVEDIKLKTDLMLRCVGGYRVGFERRNCNTEC